MATTILNTVTSSVMTGVSTFGHKVSDAFGINQATLSGAIDIVVIKHPPGSRPRCLDEEYKLNAPHTDHYPFDDISIDDFKNESQDNYICSPFHVRFGKLQLLRSNEVNVSITINNEQIDNLQMKLGAAGEAYFVVPTNKPLKHKKLLTSPLIKPQSQPTDAPSNNITSMVPLEPILSAEQLPQLNLSKMNLNVPAPSNLDMTSSVVVDENNRDITASSITSNNDDVSIMIDRDGDDDDKAKGVIKDEEAIECKSNYTSPSKDAKETPSPSKDGKETSLSVTSSGNGGDITSNIETMGNSPTLSVTSSILEDREVMSQLNIDSATATDNESVTEESNMESLDGGDIFNNFSATHVMIERIEMSLCGHLLSADSETKNKQLFEKHVISYSEFCDNPSLVFDSNLIILYNKRLYPAKIAFPMLFALLSFGQSLSNKAIKKLNKKEEKKVKEEKERKNTDDQQSEDVDNNDYSWYWSWFKKRRKKKKKYKKKKVKMDDDDHDKMKDDDDEFDVTTKGVLLSDGKMGYFRKSLRPTSEMLSKLPLKEGVNNITFTVSSTLQGTQSISGCIFLWDASSKIVISDVDGTITKSDVMGHVAPLIVGSQWSHNGVAELFTNIESNGYQMLYLTSRGIGQSSVTRSYLFENVKQKNFSLPSGPIIMSPDSLTAAFYREVIIKRPQEFKIPALTNIQSLFPSSHNPFYAGFGNRETDLESYLKVGVPKHRIFIIKPSGNINTNNTLFHTTYNELNDDVDSLFMDQQNIFSKEKEEFNTFNYWRDDTYYGNLSDIDDDSNEKKKNKNIDNDNDQSPDSKKNTSSQISISINTD